jgi:beta-aspartyl-peptidase (threonine type)
MSNYAIAIHGGAGTILRSTMTPEKEIEYKQALADAINAGELVLIDGGSALDAVEAAIVSLENNPLFNAGKGAVFTNMGKNEMDASLMDGKDLRAGAVAGVQNIKNPITLSRAVMDQSEHVMLAGLGAMEFAEKVGVEFADDEYFFVPMRFEQLQKAKESDTMILDHTEDDFENGEKKFGTVGCVALDVHGNIAAGTSTGGMTNKKYGRVGDAPLIGVGTYANEQVGVSCTGWGEYFIRNVVAHDLAALMAYKGLTVKAAGDEIIYKKVPNLGGDGGLIALDKEGNVTMPFNTEGMYRGTLTSDGKIEVYIYKD